MRRLVLLSVSSMALGGGIGFAACWFMRPAPAAVTENPPAGDEVVVELRVKLPPGAVRPEDGHSASSVRQGVLVNTGEPFDLAIQGDGFFQLTLPNGETAYTRDQSFGVNRAGDLVTRQGYPVTPAVKIPVDTVSVAVGVDGTVTVVNATGQVSAVGQITLARFLNPGWLKRDELGMWRETVESGPPHTGQPGTDTFGLVQQGFRERQAALDAAMLVDLVREFVREEQVRVRVER